MMKLCHRSLNNLVGVHPDLVRVVERVAAITTLDFKIIEGLRTRERQEELVAIGASRTMNGRHLTGHAVDAAVFVGGEVRWDWPLYYTLAGFFRQAALDCDVSLVWGAVWDRKLNEISEDIHEEVLEYSDRCRAARIKPLLDGPHYELHRKAYP